MASGRHGVRGRRPWRACLAQAFAPFPSPPPPPLVCIEQSPVCAATPHTPHAPGQPPPSSSAARREGHRGLSHWGNNRAATGSLGARPRCPARCSGPMRGAAPAHIVRACVHVYGRACAHPATCSRRHMRHMRDGCAVCHVPTRAMCPRTRMGWAGQAQEGEHWPSADSSWSSSIGFASMGVGRLLGTPFPPPPPPHHEPVDTPLEPVGQIFAPEQAREFWNLHGHTAWPGWTAHC